MDAVDQAITSLKLQLRLVPAGQEVRSRRAVVPPKEAFPPVTKRASGQGRHKKELQEWTAGDLGMQGNQGFSPLVVVPVGLTSAPDASVQATVQSIATNVPVQSLGATPEGLIPGEGDLGQAPVQGIATVMIGSVAADDIVQNVGLGMAKGGSSAGESVQQDVVANLASVLP
ncbi:hypothetical protein NDU88_001703 [Pleurodeles waltl]|uniref:Uncharacterized protein n=1 Tax=Pleurodeles waltl TaxID=8319 RepID=A0AAV7TII2_PLEWA|nr:hypothetical protein NDU88_001702 [Pleurodeles waltl]KAJ1176422.1 hypothetical protein NDU88_001703 [Pleurodeles waltl]